MLGHPEIQWAAIIYQSAISWGAYSIFRHTQTSDIVAYTYVLYIYLYMCMCVCVSSFYVYILYIYIYMCIYIYTIYIYIHYIYIYVLYIYIVRLPPFFANKIPKRKPVSPRNCAHPGVGTQEIILEVSLLFGWFLSWEIL